MSHTTLLFPLGWPADAESGTMAWTREESERSGMTASLTLSPRGELIMSSQSQFNGRSQARFMAHAAAGADFARVSMPGYEVDKMPVAQAVALFRAHVDSMQVCPSFQRSSALSARI